MDGDVKSGGMATAQRFGLRIPFGAIDDPYLRRLAIAETLLKEGFDSSEPRDDRGRWTNGDGSAAVGAATAAAAGAGAEGGAGWAAWDRATLALLPRVAADVGGPLAIAGGLILVPTNKSLVREGTLPGRPDVSYRVDEIEVRLYREDDQGNRALFFVATRDSDNLYHDEQGRVIGRLLDGAVVLDPDTVADGVPPLSEGSRAKEKDPAKERGLAASRDAATAQVRAIDTARLCPDPDFDVPNGSSPRAMAYQTQITRMPPGLAFYLEDSKVSFDGCRYWGDGAMLEAKGEGLGQHLTPDGWKPYWTDPESDIRQMRAQSEAAAKANKFVEWHVSEKIYANYLGDYARRNFSNVVVVWEPALPLWRPANQKREFMAPGSWPLQSIGRSLPYGGLGRAVGL